MFSTSLFLSNLKTKEIARDIKYIQKTGSTNDTIYNMYNNGEIKSGSVLISEKQVNGRGRRGNKWFSSYGENLTFSFIISNQSNKLMEKLPLISGISIVNAIRELTQIDCMLKWPNDIVFDAKKIGGILIERKKGHFIIGMGVNVNQTKFHSSIKKTACSIHSVLNSTIDREPLLAYIFNHFEKLLEMNTKSIISSWESLCAHINKTIKLSDNSEIIKGEFLGLNKNGEAKIKFKEEEKVVQSGVVNY